MATIKEYARINEHNFEPLYRFLEIEYERLFKYV